MRAVEFITELNKKPKPPKAGDTTPHEYDLGWENLNWLKNGAAERGKELAGSLQLFVPRRLGNTKRSERVKSLFDRPYVWNDEGELDPEAQKWVNQGVIGESNPPILQPGKAVSPPGRNKPTASLWTSTAEKSGDGYTSAWSRWTENNQPDWFSDVGYLYRVKPGALILGLDSDRDAERIMSVFIDLKRVDKDVNDKLISDRYMALHGHFPWNEVVKHFDAVNHEGYSSYRDDFIYGWDVESTAWFDTSFLQYLGPVKVHRNVRKDDTDESK